ncbi:uncharacterized protein EV422DRAFT_264279 [Fimicolochytrium jonesii]|uniref:uncharacterized protein n=1 Tax=Fimicolochytrium jonesii TaxID=1396493 RepID=UPI0022FEB6F7|nr:uncharacterized protein EV422DRAFT_264279 [Fimicolochytrium jonesii]KAI8817088.1 hypothetical protein EV422DRAFT_264279 [Fimicolochytrium jonesii]
MPPPLTASIITSFTCYTLANLLGLLSLAHVGRHHLGLRAEGAPRNYLQTLAHTCMLIVYALSFHTGYGCAATTDGNEGGESAGTCDRGLRIPDGFFIFGSFLLLFSLQVRASSQQSNPACDTTSAGTRSLKPPTFFCSQPVSAASSAQPHSSPSAASTVTPPPT